MPLAVAIHEDGGGNRSRDAFETGRRRHVQIDSKDCAGIERVAIVRLCFALAIRSDSKELESDRERLCMLLRDYEGNPVRPPNETSPLIRNRRPFGAITTVELNVIPP